MSINSHLVEQIIFDLLSSCIHISCISCLQDIGYAPKYAIVPAERIASPTIFSYCRPRSSAFFFQRARSPPKPEIKLSARCNFTAHKFASASRLAFLSFCFFNSVSIASSLSNIVFKSALVAFNPTMTSSYAASASFNASCFGATIFATLSYLSIAQTHLHKPSAALDAFAAFSGVNNGFEMYTDRIFCMTFIGMLSLSYDLSVSRKSLSFSNPHDGFQ
mmetsp:Transcript_7116/g.22147  ORF Transcript_7116/g.22147 Transcript_7116/m.22147 type:complete len:219 (+) Transcript_7116:3558-4214(+)